MNTNSVMYDGNKLSSRVNECAVGILGVDSGWTLDSSLNRTQNGALKNQSKFNKCRDYAMGNRKLRVIIECSLVNTSDGRVFIDYIGGRNIILNSNQDIVLGWVCDCRTSVDFGNNVDLAVQSLSDFERAVADNIKRQLKMTSTTEFAIKVKNAVVRYYKVPTNI